MLELGKTQPFARPFVNSGRLSSPTPYVHSSLNTPDEEPFAGAMTPGTNCADAPITVAGKDGWFLNALGDGFVLLVFGPGGAARPVACGGGAARVLTVGEDIRDEKGVLTARYDGRPGTVYLIRPDQCGLHEPAARELGRGC